MAPRRRRARKGVLEFWGERPSWETGEAVFAFWGRYQSGVVDLAVTIQGRMQTGGPSKTELGPFVPIMLQKPTAQYQPHFDFFLSAKKVVPKNDGEEMDRAIARALASKK